LAAYSQIKKHRDARRGVFILKTVCSSLDFIFHTLSFQKRRATREGIASDALH
jgi:hypothetical protein